MSRLTTDVRDHLIAQSVAVSGTTSAWSCLIGGTTDQIAEPHMTVIARPGIPPLDSHDGPGNEQPACQIIVRGADGGYAAAETKAWGVFDALHRQTVGSWHVAATTSPAWVGYEPDSNRPRWSLNFQATEIR